MGGEVRHDPVGELRHGSIEGELHDVLGIDDSGEGVKKSVENSEDGREKSNFFGLNYLLWFEFGIEGKDSMDHSEEDWGGRLEFGFKEEKFDKNFEDYFILFEDQCTLSHNCAGRVSGLQAHVREKVLEPPTYDTRNMVNLLEKYGDAHLSDFGWREIEWFENL